MKILHVGKYFWPFQGGLESYMRDLMVALAKRGITSAALVHRHDWSLSSREETICGTGQDIRLVRTGTWARLFFTPISPAFPWRLRQLIATSKPDILHLHMPNPSAFWALLWPSARRLPWVVHWHADVITASQGSLMKVMYFFYRPFERAILKRARAIVATSAAYRDTSGPLQPWLVKCHVVPLGMDAMRLAAASPSDQPERTGLPGLRVLAVGRLTYYKGLRYLVEAAARVNDLHLDLVGHGEQAAALRRQVAALGLEERVTFHGAATNHDLARLMAQCDCLCLPSIERTEAFGMVLLEAMSFGKATVVSDVPGSGMGWIVDHGVTGLKVEPANAEALAGAFRQLADDRETLRRMGERGRDKYSRLFDINHAVEGVVDIYHEVMENPPTA